MEIPLALDNDRISVISIINWHTDNLDRKGSSKPVGERSWSMHSGPQAIVNGAKVTPYARGQGWWELK